jgi:hypothetical protein
MANLTHLPHVRNIKSGINRWDPNHSAVFEVYFTLPAAIQGQFAEDEAILTEQVTDVSGLDQLQKNTPVGKQRFMNVDVSHSAPVIDETRATITIVFNLNLRNVTDNFVLKVLMAWKNLNYNLADGTRTLKNTYVADNLRIAEANRDGTIWRSYVFHDVILGDVTGIDTLNYDDNEARKITAVFVSDFWDDDIA